MTLTALVYLLIASYLYVVHILLVTCALLPDEGIALSLTDTQILNDRMRMKRVRELFRNELGNKKVGGINEN